MIDPRGLWDRDAEEAVLGAALVDAAAADECLALLRPEAFYRDAHRRVWQAVADLRQRHQGCDALTVGDALQAAGTLEGCGGIGYLSDLVAAVATTTNATDHAALVVEAHVRREVVRATRRAVALASDPAEDVAEALAALNAAIRAITEAAASSRSVQGLDAWASAAYAAVERLYERDESPGLSTGLPVLDGTLGGGLYAGELAILGGRPSVGKSSLAQQLASVVARAGGRVLFASAEMHGESLGARELAHESGVDGRRLRGYPPLDGDEWPRLANALGSIAQYGGRVPVDDKSRTIEAIATECRRQHARDPLSLLVVDHLQHLRSPRGVDNRAQAVGQMAQECKDLATGLGIAVLALSQLNRAAPGGDRQPRLHDLRDSGELEQIADVVILLHRDAEDNPPPAVDVRLIVAKQRNGQTGALTLRHHRPTGRWFDPRPAREGR